MDWIVPNDKNEFAKIESINRQLKKAKSPKTEANWKHALCHFFKFVKIHPDEFVKMEKSKIEDVIESYTDSLKIKVQNNELNPNSIQAKVSPLVKFLAFNRVDGMQEAWIRLRANYPERKRTRDEKYDERELLKMYQFSNIRQKAVLGLLMSGMRIGATKDLKIKDLKPIEDWSSIVVYAGTNSEYTTFVTPQGYRDISDYLDYRKRNGETITPDSPLIRNEFRPEKAGYWVDKFGIKRGPESIKTTIGFTHIVIKLLRDAGIMENSHNHRTRHKTMMCHGFRKYVNTVCKTSGMDSERVEILLGHSNSSLAGHYWRLPTDESEMSPQELKLYQTIKSEYRKCIPELTIGESELLKIKNEQLQETVSVELKQKDFEILELQRQLAKVRTNPFVDMQPEEIEKFVEMFEDWKKFKEHISLLGNK